MCANSSFLGAILRKTCVAAGFGTVADFFFYAGVLAHALRRRARAIRMQSFFSSPRRNAVLASVSANSRSPLSRCR